MDSNRKRQALDEVVTLEARHDQFTASRKAVNLHVDVVFTTGRIGGEEDSNVRFRLRLKRAEVVVIVPAREPAVVDGRSIRREGRKLKATYSESRRTKDSRTAKLAAKIAASLGNATATADASADFQVTIVEDQSLKVTERVPLMRVTQKTRGDEYAWLIEPGINRVLEGRPWDEDVEPRMKINDTRSEGSRRIEPNIRVEVRCLREDLEVYDIRVLRERRFVSVIKDTFGRNKLAAAEAVIRTRLFREGLDVGDLSDPFARMTLCSVVAEN